MLYFIRHGQTNHNLNKLLAGRCNIELNETGINQAKKAATESKNTKIDLILCSPLTRAKQTALIINIEHNVPILIKEELIERDFGKYESKDYSSIEGDKVWNYYCDEYSEDMETIKEVFDRVYKLLDEIKSKYKNKNVLIVAHNDIGRAVQCYFNGIPRDGNVRDLSVANAKIIEYEWKKKVK